MRFYLLITFFFLHLQAYAHWILEQIQEDLTPYPKICKEELLTEMQSPRAAANSLVFIEIKDNHVQITGDKAMCPPRYEAVEKFFNKLASCHSLPDVAFLLSLHDSVEREGPFAKEFPNVPIFTFAKRKTAPTILFPDFEALDTSDTLIANCAQFSKKYPWQKKQPLIFWRGASTGAYFSLDNYLLMPRVKLVMLSLQHSLWLDAGFTTICQADAAVSSLFQRYTKPSCALKDHFRYKYLIDVDGNSCTYSRCRWILLSNCALLKQQSPNIQWYYKALQPHIHYVPIKEDLSDLTDVYNWLRKHDEQAESIAKAGELLGKEIFSSYAIDLYVRTLLAEYAKHYDPTNPILMK